MRWCDAIMRWFSICTKQRMLVTTKFLLSYLHFNSFALWFLLLLFGKLSGDISSQQSATLARVYHTVALVHCTICSHQQHQARNQVTSFTIDEDCQEHSFLRIPNCNPVQWWEDRVLSHEGPTGDVAATALATASGGGGNEVALAQDFIAVVRDWHAFAVVVMWARCLRCGHSDFLLCG